MRLRRYLSKVLGLAAAAAAFAALPASAHITECDWVGGHSTDPQRQAPGLPTGQINWKGAVFACERDLAADPTNAHLMYLLGHLLYYDHKWRDWPRSLKLLQDSAAKGYPQAHFALGNFYSNGELGALLPKDMCKGAQHHLIAARWGRYASLVSYSRFAVKGFYDGCAEKVDWDEVARFLDLARGAAQYDFYGGLLIDDLEELLAVKRKK